MTDSQPRPDRITKPIQLLAAWLTGLFSLNASFLLAATQLGASTWQGSALVVAAILNVPVFLGAAFVLQTKFRPELQEDAFYSTYLSRKTNERITYREISSDIEIEARRTAQEVLSEATGSKSSEVEGLARLSYGVNKHLEDSEAVKTALGTRGVQWCTVFGSEKPPQSRIVAISEHLSPEMIRDVIELASNLGFTGYTIYDNHFERTEEDVLFGSYGEAQAEILRRERLPAPPN